MSQNAWTIGTIVGVIAIMWLIVGIGGRGQEGGGNRIDQAFGPMRTTPPPGAN